MRVAKRVESLPPYLFAELDRKLAAKRAEGVDVISLGVGDPDLPTPEHVVEAMREAVLDPSTHRYPSYYGALEFRQAVARWYDRRFGVELDPETEVMPLIGSKEGIGHIAFAFVDPGDEALVPDPGYPVYGVSTRLAGGTPVSLPMPEDAGFLPDLEAARGERAHEGDLAELPEQPDGRRGRPRDVRGGDRVRARARPDPAATTPRTARSRSTGTWRPRPCKCRVRRTSRSSSARCRSSTT